MGTTSKKTSWFSVDKNGLAKLRAGAPKSALVFELVQNVLDTAASYCRIELTEESGRLYRLVVEDDDPKGFHDLAHAYTLFAESVKKGDAEKRGRFNLGEKLVLALCQGAVIESTTGTVVFAPDGREEFPRRKLAKGSRFTGDLRLTKAEREEIENSVHALIVPEACTVTFNGVAITRPLLIKSTEDVLPTVIGDEEGVLRPSRRKTRIDIYHPRPDDKPMIYEMGIPVVESGDRYHYNVNQKIPLTLDRSNVTPAFLRDVRCAAAEALIDYIEAEDANQEWVRTAAASPNASPALVETVFEARFGKGAVIRDPNDPEANLRAMADGRTVVTGSQMSKDEWANVKSHGVSLPAGRVFMDHRIETDPDGREWQQATRTTPGMMQVETFTKEFARATLGIEIAVEFVSEVAIGMAACYGGRCLRFNIGKLGYKAFDRGLTTSLMDLIIHELAHEKASNHLSTEFYNACTEIGAAGITLALTHPELFNQAGLTLAVRA